MKQSVTSLFTLYLSRSDLRESTIEVYGRAIRWFVEMFGDVAVGRLGYEHAEDYKVWLGKGRSRGAANTYLRAIKPFFAWLAKRRYIEHDPFDNIKLYKTGEQKHDQYTVDEIERILTVADLRWQVIVLLALNSMRRAEILNLVLSDIDFEKNMILISPKKDTEYTWLWEIKNHNQAYIGLPEPVAKLIVRLKDYIPEKQPYICLKATDYQRNMRLKAEGKLDHRKRNNPWGNFNRDFRSLLHRSHVARKRFHDLRGTFATERYRDGYSLKEIQSLLRHASIQTTAHYIKNIEEQELVAKSVRTFNQHYVTPALKAS